MKRPLILTFIVVLLAGLLLPACATSDFSKPASLGDIEQALAGEGLQVCASQDVPALPSMEIVGGKVYDLDQDCASYDPNQPGARVFVMQFNSVQARNGALRRYTSENRRILAPAFALTHGPYLIAVDGPQTPRVAAAVKQALLKLGAQ